jgi:uncharacterized protein (TIGR02271 family)
MSRDDTLMIPVLEEELDAQKATVETGRVRITKVIHEREEIIEEPLWQEQVTVERVPVNQRVSGPVPVRQEGSTVIIPILEEVLVIEKRCLLREELHIHTQRIAVHKPQIVTLHREEAVVERLDNQNRKES